MSLFIVVVLEDRAENGAESGAVELSTQKNAKNCIITPGKIYATLCNFCNRRCHDDPDYLRM